MTVRRTHEAPGSSPRLRAASTWLAIAVSVVAVIPAAHGSAQADDWTPALAGIVEETGFSGAILLFDGSEVVLSKGYGLADRESGRPVTERTVFDIGSLAKLFTRAAVLDLAERGALTLEDRLGVLLEGVPEDKAAITVGQLVEHRSGLPEYILSYAAERERGDIHFADHGRATRGEALAWIYERALEFEPGTTQQYSNAGYTVLAAIVEEVSGRPFTTYVHERLIEPAGLVQTGFYGADIWAPDEGAVGQDDVKLDSNDPTQWPPISWMLMGAGGMVSNPRELHRWLEALETGLILPGPLGRAMARQQGERGVAGGNHYGFVNFVVPVESGRLVISANSEIGARETMGAVRRLLEERTSGSRGGPSSGEPVGTEAPKARPETADELRSHWGVPPSDRGLRAAAVLEAIERGEAGYLDDLLTEHFVDLDEDDADAVRALLLRLAERHDGLRMERVVMEDEENLQLGFTADTGGSGALLLVLERRRPYRIRTLRPIE